MTHTERILPTTRDVRGVPHGRPSQGGAGGIEREDPGANAQAVLFHARQIQDFIPAPMTGEKLHIAKEKERRLMKTILQFCKPENHPILRKLFMEMGRRDLIGPKGLV